MNTLPKRNYMTQNNKKMCCLTNKLGNYYDGVIFEQNKWATIDGNKPDGDGGEHLGECEGFNLRDSKVYVSGKIFFVTCTK